MNINVSGQNISIGQSLQSYVVERLEVATSKYFSNLVSGKVHFSKSGFEFCCDILINDGTGHHSVIKSNAKSDEPYAAFDEALNKVAKQLRRYKSKLKNRSDRVKLSEVTIDATKYVIDAKGNVANDDEDTVDFDNP